MKVIGVKFKDGGKIYYFAPRENETYELGSADSADAFRNWLRNSIGSNFYYDSNDTAGLSSAYDKIFEEIRKELEKKVTGKWVTEDPVPEYISFVIWK